MLKLQFPMQGCVWFVHSRTGLLTPPIWEAIRLKLDLETAMVVLNLVNAVAWEIGTVKTEGSTGRKKLINVDIQTSLLFVWFLK